MKKIMLLAFVSCHLLTFSQEMVTLEVTGIEDGLIYINEIYTGLKAPSTISIPANDSVRIGVGQEGGGYYQKTVRNSRSSAINMSDLKPLPQKAFSMLILPVLQTIHGEELAILKDIDIEMAKTIAGNMSKVDIHNGSFGLMRWDVNVFPTVKNTVLYREPTTGAIPNLRRFLSEANLNHLRNEYDVIVLFYSIYKDDDTRIENKPCCLWGGRGEMFIDNGQRFTYLNNPTPEKMENAGWVHEWLHGIERMNPEAQPLKGLHSAIEHGYQKHELGYTHWRYWYYHFMTSQVPKIENSEELPFVGVFDVLKNWNRDKWQDSEPSTLSIADIDDPSKNDFKVFPNPAAKTLYFQGGSIETSQTPMISVIDINGRILLRKKLAGKSSIDVATLRPGIYFLIINEKAPVRFVKI